MLAKFSDDAQSGALGSVTEQDLPTKLEERWANYLKKHVPRKNYNDDSAWLSAVIDKIDDQLLKLSYTMITTSKIEEEFSDELFVVRELAVEERLDAVNDKVIKRLGQIKTMKAMGIGTRHASVIKEPLKQIYSPAIQAAKND